MTPAKRAIKRTIIVIVYLVIFSLLGMAVYYGLIKPAPTCFDGIRNQKEEGIDCGGPCGLCQKMPDAQNLKVLEKVLIPGTSGKYDALVRIANPNSQYGAARFDYSFDFQDSSGKIIGKKEDSDFILPNETKYILLFNLPVSGSPNSLDFKIRSFRWVQFVEYEEPEIVISDRVLNLVSSGSGFAQLKAKIKNLSGYDFKKITVRTVLRNQDGDPIATNETSVNDVRVGEEREVIFNWSDPFALDPASATIELESEINVFDSDNFMKKYGSSEQYKSYIINDQGPNNNDQ